MVGYPIDSLASCRPSVLVNYLFVAAYCRLLLLVTRSKLCCGFPDWWQYSQPSATFCHFWGKIVVL